MGDIPHDTRKNLYVRLAQRIIDNITTLVWNFFSRFCQWITYTHFSYLHLHWKYKKRVIFCHFNLPPPIDISLLKTWSWQCESYPFRLMWMSHGEWASLTVLTAHSPPRARQTQCQLALRRLCRSARFPAWSMQVWPSATWLLPRLVLTLKTGNEIFSSVRTVLFLFSHLILSPSPSVHSI